MHRDGRLYRVAAPHPEQGGSQDRAYSFIGILGALGDHRFFGNFGGCQDERFTPTAVRHSRGARPRGPYLWKTAFSSAN
jgi:hypothetical protein